VVEGSGAESLAKRLFAARVELIGEMDGKRPNAPPADGYVQVSTPRGHMGEVSFEPDRPEVGKLRDDLAAELRTEISGMSLDNFLVRPHRRYVEKYSSTDAWTNVDGDARHELIDHVAGLPSAVVDDDLAAKQFDLVVYRTQLALLRVDPAFNGLRARITEIASLLEGLGNVPMVAAEMALILEIQTDAFWQDVTLPMLETVRRRLRALVKLIEHKKRPLVYSDFEDRAGAGIDATVPGIAVGTDMDAFRRKARVFLRPHENYIAVLKVKRNEPLTATDLAELERIFVEAGTDERSIAAIRADGGVGRFVRSLVGLDREAAKRSFAAFLERGTLTANQLEFLNLVIDHLTARGTMDPRLLYETPFTDFDAKGVEGVFPQADVVQLIQVLRDIEGRSVA